MLKAQPGNFETMRILGALYANSDNEEKREIAKSHLKKVTDQFTDDVESWLMLSDILWQSDLQASLNANVTASKIFKVLPKFRYNPIKKKTSFNKERNFNLIVYVCNC